MQAFIELEEEEKNPYLSKTTTIIINPPEE